MSSSPFNNGEEDTRVVQEDLRRDEAGEAAMEEEDRNPFGVHSPASERGTLAGISTHPNPHQALQEIQGLKDLLMVILENTTSSPPPSSSPPKENWVSGMGTPLGFPQAWERCPGIVSTHYLFAFTYFSSIFCFRWIKIWFDPFLFESLLSDLSL